MRSAAARPDTRGMETDAGAGSSIKLIALAVVCAALAFPAAARRTTITVSGTAGGGTRGTAPRGRAGHDHGDRRTGSRLPRRRPARQRRADPERAGRLDVRRQPGRARA